MTGRSATSSVDVLEATADAVVIASRALVGVAAKSMASIDGLLTLPQYRALVLIGSRGEQNVSSLADALDIHPSTATRLCDRLLAKGLIERSTSTESRREVTLRLSPDGQALVRSVTTRRRREIRRILSRLDTADLEKLTEAFEVFADAAGELHEQASKLGWTA